MRDLDVRTRVVGWVIIAVNVGVFVSLIVRDVEPVLAVVVLAFGLAAGALTLTGRTGAGFWFLLVATVPSITSWYIAFFLPLLVLLAVVWARRARHPADEEPLTPASLDLHQPR